MQRGSGRRTRLETRLNALSTPVFALDASRTILFFNRGCEQLLEWSAEEILGQTCDYAIDTDTDECESVRQQSFRELVWKYPASCSHEVGKRFPVSFDTAL